MGSRRYYGNVYDVAKKSCNIINIRTLLIIITGMSLHYYPWLMDAFKNTSTLVERNCKISFIIFLALCELVNWRPPRPVNLKCAHNIISFAVECITIIFCTFLLWDCIFIYGLENLQLYSASKHYNIYSLQMVLDGVMCLIVLYSYGIPSAILKTFTNYFRKTPQVEHVLPNIHPSERFEELEIPRGRAAGRSSSRNRGRGRKQSTRARS